MARRARLARRHSAILAEGCDERGQLGDRPLVQLLIGALDEGMTGSLCLLDPSGCEHVLRFLHGLPAGVETRREVAPLGEILRAMGLPDDDTLEVRLASGSCYDMLTLRSMAWRGQLDQAVAFEAIRRQLLERLRALLGLAPETRYFVHHGRNMLSSYHQREPIDCDEGDVLRLVSHGVRRRDAGLPIQRTLAPWSGTPLRLRGDAPLVHLDLLEAEREVVSALLRDALTVDELLACALAPETTVHSVAYLLVVLRFVHVAGDERPPAGLVRRARSGVVLRSED